MLPTILGGVYVLLSTFIILSLSGKRLKLLDELIVSRKEQLATVRFYKSCVDDLKQIIRDQWKKEQHLLIENKILRKKLSNFMTKNK